MFACYWKKTTGLDCPGCGVQRSFQDITNGDLISAWNQYPAIYPLIILMIYTFLHLWRPQKFEAKHIVILMSISAILILVNWIKNLLL